MADSVKIRGVKKDFYTYIVEYIKSHGKLPVGHYSRQQLHYYTKALQSDEIIRHLGNGVWVVDNDNLDKLNFLLSVKKGVWHTNTPWVKKYTKNERGIRGHGYQLHVEIPSKYRVRQLLDAVKIRGGGQFVNHGRVVRLVMDGRIIWVSLRSIVIFFKESESLFGETAKDCEGSAIYQATKCLKKIEGMVKISLRVAGRYQIKVSKSEYANVDNELAKDFNDRSEELKVFHNGKCWLIIDKSFNRDEFEVVGNDSAKNMDNVVMPLFNGIKEHYEATGEITTFQSIQKSIHDLAEQNKTLAAGLSCVVKVLEMQTVKPQMKPEEPDNTELRRYCG